MGVPGNDLVGVDNGADHRGVREAWTASSMTSSNCFAGTRRALVLIRSSVWNRFCRFFRYRSDRSMGTSITLGHSARWMTISSNERDGRRGVDAYGSGGKMEQPGYAACLISSASIRERTGPSLLMEMCTTADSSSGRAPRESRLPSSPIATTRS